MVRLLVAQLDENSRILKDRGNPPKQATSVNILCKNLLVYYCKCFNLIDYAILAIYSWIDGKAEFLATRRQGRVFSKKIMLIPLFLNNFEEVTNTSLFLLKQLDYSLEIELLN